MPGATLLLAAWAAAAAPAATVTGRVTDEAGRAIATAHVQCASRPEQPARRVFVRAGGEAAYRLETEASHVYCTIGAPGYEPLRRTVRLTDGAGSFGTAVLRRLVSLQVGRPLVSRGSAAKSTAVDVTLRNESDRSREIRRVRLTGTALLATSCYDPRPAVDFTIADRIALVGERDRPVGSAVDVALQSARYAWRDQVSATGFLQRLGCGQSRLQIDMDYVLLIEPGTSIKLRFQLPNAFRAGRGRSTGPLQLERWAGIGLSFVLSDGSTVTSQ